MALKRPELLRKDEYLKPSHFLNGTPFSQPALSMGPGGLAARPGRPAPRPTLGPLECGPGLATLHLAVKVVMTGASVLVLAVAEQTAGSQLAACDLPGALCKYLTSERNLS